MGEGLALTISTKYIFKGCLYQKENIQDTTELSRKLGMNASATGNSYNGLGFDANKSNSIYQDNAEVKTKNLSIKLWSRIF